MKPMHWTVHVRPANSNVGTALQIDGHTVQTIEAEQQALGDPFPVSFEEVLERFATLSRMFAEPDGSFVWRGSGSLGDWQLDGQLYDRNDRLLYAELNGTIDADALGTLLRSFGWPETSLAFQLTRAAVLLEEAEFRRLLFS